MAIVAIVGRPNVGKSTLFNRLIEKKEAIISNISGTTRDRKYGECVWNGEEFIVIDTGGYKLDVEKNCIASEINRQVKIAIEEADVILFLVDVHDGIIGEDKDFANVLRRYTKKKEIIIVVNKVDNDKLGIEAYEFLKLGFEKMYSIAAISGSGTGDLLDEIVSILKKNDEWNSEIESENNKATVEKKNELKKIPKFAIIGQPNVGKSSLLNVLIGEERTIVDNKSGTTRDSIDTLYNLFGKEFILIDTAGIRKKSKKKDDIEFYSTLRALKSLEKCDVCLYVIDAMLGIENEDLKLMNLAIKYNKGILLIVNKWDLIRKEDRTAEIFKKSIYERLKNNYFIPIIFVSALKKKNIFKIVEKGLEINKNLNTKIDASKLTDCLLEEIKKNPPSSKRGRKIKITQIKQLPTKNITFAFFCNYSNSIDDNYKNFLRNRIYENFKLEGIPISLTFRDK